MSSQPIVPTPTTPPPFGPPPPPRAPAANRLLPALVAVLAIGGGLLVWRSMSNGGAHQMGTGSVTVSTFAGDVTLAPGETVTPVSPTSQPTSTAVSASTVESTTTTPAPTTATPTTVAPTTAAPTTVAPTTVAPTTAAPTTAAPTTVAPATAAPTTVAPTPAATVPPTVPPTAAPTTAAPATPTTRVSPGGVTFATTCTSSDGWRVGVPAGWFTGQPGTIWQCSLFDVIPVAPGQAGGDVVYPISIQYVPTIDDAYHTYWNAEYYEMLSQASIDVGGYGADRLELRSTDVGELGAGVEVIVYIIVLDATTGVTIEGTATDLDYSMLKRLVDAMAGDIVFTR